MKIVHNPVSKDVKHIEDLYSLKDKVPIKYVCTSSVKPRGMIYDIFYRADDSPHPEFGNRYFGIGFYKGIPYITNADNIENLEFGIINGVYSRNEHDFVDTGVGVFLDGGRDYIRRVGDITIPVRKYRIHKGEFVENETGT